MKIYMVIGQYSSFEGSFSHNVAAYQDEDTATRVAAELNTLCYASVE